MSLFPWMRRAKDASDESLSETLSPPSASNFDSVRWQTLLETTEDAVLLADAEGRIQQSNSVASALFGVSGGTSLLAHTLSTDLEDLYRTAVRRGAGMEREVTLSQPSPRTLHVRITPVAAGEYLLVLRDLTELRRLERVRRDFVANVSHELRTPLTSIKAMAETLLDGARHDEEVAPRFLQTVIRESDRLVRLSADLLDLSRVEALGIEKKPIDLAILVSEVAARLASQAEKADVSLTNTIRAPLVVHADRDEMAQVLVNLLDNAIAYTPRGGLVTLSAAETHETISVAVADTGIGILSHDIPRLFERFYRADKARSRASGGTGLGLSIVKHVVQAHGGQVSVESQPGRGAAFQVRLPLAQHEPSGAT